MPDFKIGPDILYMRLDKYSFNNNRNDNKYRSNIKYTMIIILNIKWTPLM